MQLQLLLTGNEIMSGDTVDSNSSMIAQRLQREGYWVDRKVTVGDEFDVLVDELQQISRKADALIVNGGLGPTMDDLTAEALAKAAGINIVEHAGAKKHVVDWCDKRGFKANEANLKQAQLPEDVSLLPNAVGSAVGFALTLNDCLVLCTPGVPSELRAMLEDGIVPALNEAFPANQKSDILRYQTFGLGESGVQQMLTERFPDWPSEEVEIGFRAGAPLLEMKLRVAPTCSKELRQKCEQDFLSVIGDYVIGRDDTTMASAMVELLSERKQSIALAESCTGGLIASQLTSVPGSSEVFEAGIVSYSNAIKQSVLGVSQTTLEKHGAVSEACVLEMARGALNLSGADHAIAVSGVAGPGGGSDEKPAGTVWIAWGGKDDLQARRFYYPLGRSMFQTITAALALDLVRRNMLQLGSEPAYFQRRDRPAKAED